MWLRVRQIAVAARDLRETALDVQTVLGLEACFTDPGVAHFGLKNTLWPIGTQFLECVTPVSDGTAAGRYIERRGGDTGYMVITEVDDVEHRKSHVDEIGVRVAWPLDFADEGHSGIQLHPADTGGSFFEMDQMTMPGGGEPGGPWWPAGRSWKPYVRTDRVSAISGVELQSPDPARLAATWSRIAEIDLDDVDGVPTLACDNASIRFVEATDGRGEGLAGIDVVTEDRDKVLAGARARDCYVSDDEVAVAGLRVLLR